MALDNLIFDNRFTGQLPSDPDTSNSRRQVYGSCYSHVKPTRVARPHLISHSPEAAALLDLDSDTCNGALFTELFAGNTLLEGMVPFAMCYGGHQFGNWAGQLGDGRAINLGEIVNRRGERWMLQLKGAGPTPYSRRADGLAVLRSSIREYLCSEAMYHLGIPTTRALSLIGTGEPVLRDMFYDGHPAHEPGAVVCRLSPSFTRFGNFQIFTSRNELDTLAKLVNHTITTDFPHLGEPSDATYMEWFREICSTTAALMVHWMRVGFVHGVMNTDNMSVLGLTIDYGPYGWLEGYEPGWTPNTTDESTKRYAFGNQPSIAMWNLTQLANSLLSLFGTADEFQEVLQTAYRQEFVNGWQQMMAAKLGLQQYLEQYDEPLFSELLDILTLTETDMTIFFRQLALMDPRKIQQDQKALPEELRPALYKEHEADEKYLKRLSRWLLAYGDRTVTDGSTPEERVKRMNSTNPRYILRNYLASEAIELAEAGDYSRIEELLDMVRQPYREHSTYEKYYRKRPEWARTKPGCARLS